jgi:hypothetical protein
MDISISHIGQRYPFLPLFYTKAQPTSADKRRELMLGAGIVALVLLGIMYAVFININALETTS